LVELYLEDPEGIAKLVRLERYPSAQRQGQIVHECLTTN